MILCCGEALIDMLPAYTATGEAAFVPHTGGAVFNTAVALGRLGQQTGLLCGLSNDIFGALLVADLAASGVSAALCPRSDRPTTLAFVTLENGHARYTFNDENTAARMLDTNALPPLPAAVDVLFLGGISLVAEPCGQAFETLLRQEAGKRMVMIDPNIRPGFIRDEGAYRARLGRMLARADIVKMSDEDLSWLSGPGRAEDHARHLINQGAALVVLTEGAACVRAWTAAGHARITPPEVIVADTVGAGDAFNAGLLDALLRSIGPDRRKLPQLDTTTLERALTAAAQVAALTVSRAGANPPWRAELEAMHH